MLTWHTTYVLAANYHTQLVCALVEEYYVMMSAAVSPDKRLRFDVTTKPAWESKRSDAANEAWTAR